MSGPERVAVLDSCRSLRGQAEAKNLAMISPGNRTAWFLILERKYGFAGDVKVEAKGLPAGVMATSITIPPQMTQGVISVNPNTMYPLLRELEANKMIKGEWEHPDRRTRRFYKITKAGEAEYKRLVGEVEPFLDSVIRSVTLIKNEVYEGR